MSNKEIHENRLCGQTREWDETIVVCTADKWHLSPHRAMASDPAGNLSTLCTWSDIEAAAHIAA